MKYEQQFGDTVVYMDDKYFAISDFTMGFDSLSLYLKDTGELVDKEPLNVEHDCDIGYISRIASELVYFISIAED